MPAGDQPRKKRKSVLGTIIGYAVAAAALFWVFHDVNIPVLRREFAHVNWLLAAAGVLVDMGRYVTQSFRWCLLLRSVGKISVARTFQSLYAGIFLNLLLPLRMGEIARVYLASHYSGASFPSVLSTIITEYLIDGIWLASGIGAIALVIPLPVQVANPARVLGAMVLIAVTLFLFFVFRKTDDEPRKSGNGQWKQLRFILSFINNMRRSISRIGRSVTFWPALGISAFDILFHGVAYWIILVAFGIHLPLVTAMAILLFIFVGLVIPNTPSNVGSFQFLCVVGLMAFGVDKTTAGGFSVLFFVLVTIPQVVLGWIMFSLSGHRLYDIKDRLLSLRNSTKV